MTDRYPALAAVVSMTLGQKGYRGVVERIPFRDACPRDMEKVWTCDHKHRSVRTARECAAQKVIAIVQGGAE